MGMHLKVSFQPGSADWEALADLTPGVPVRVRTSDGAVHSGVLGPAGAEEIRISSGDRDFTASRKDVEQVEAYRTSRLLGAIAGGLAGAAAGVQAGLMYRGRSHAGIFRNRFRRPSNQPLLIGGLIGCGAGILAGIAVSGYRTVYLAAEEEADESGKSDES